jgi:hypothetical protein
VANWRRHVPEFQGAAYPFFYTINGSENKLERKEGEKNTNIFVANVFIFIFNRGYFLITVTARICKQWGKGGGGERMTTNETDSGKERNVIAEG